MFYRDERVARLYSKSLLLRILFVVLNDFWISNGDFALNIYIVHESHAYGLFFLRRIYYNGVVVFQESCSVVKTIVEQHKNTTRTQLNSNYRGFNLDTQVYMHIHKSIFDCNLLTQAIKQ